MKGKGFYFFFLLVLFLIFSDLSALADVDIAWVKCYNGLTDSSDEACAIAVDSSRNVYVTGVSDYDHPRRLSSGDYATIKYYPNGDTVWVRRYNGPGNAYDEARALSVDGSGNVYVTGFCSITAFPFYKRNYATIKYYPNGDSAWVRTYGGPEQMGEANAIAIDGSGNVYVTGVGSNFDYVTIKYNPNGDTVWVRRYNGPGDHYDEAAALTLDGSGNIYVTGYSNARAFPEYNYDYATIKYDSSGNELWITRYNGAADSSDWAYAVAVDGSGNVYVTGKSYGSGTDYDYATIKYNPEGDTVWVRRYNGPSNHQDWPKAMAVDGDGNVYVTGRSEGSGTWYDYATIKYYANGDTAWVRRYDGPGSNYDEAYSIAVDGSGNVYVTGGSYGGVTGTDYATIKYDSTGNQIWVVRYDGVENGADEARDMALDDSGNVYVTGFTCVGGSEWEYTTIKYVQIGTGVKDETGNREKPSKFTLFQNYPNPFNQTTKIEFTLAKSGFVSLTIYDLLGRKVKTLVSEHVFSGYKSVLWDGKNNFGNEVASGIYFYQIKVGNFTETKKLVLLK